MSFDLREHLLSFLRKQSESSPAKAPRKLILDSEEMFFRQETLLIGLCFSQLQINMKTSLWQWTLIATLFLAAQYIAAAPYDSSKYLQVSIESFSITRSCNERHVTQSTATTVSLDVSKQRRLEYGKLQR